MSKPRVFEPPAAWAARRKELAAQPGLEPHAGVLLDVELGLALMEQLGLDDEPVAAVWAVLSGTPIQHPRLQEIGAAGRRAIANARQLLPYAAHFAWLSALESYIRDVPAHWRNYDWDPAHPEEQIIAAARRERHPIHRALCTECLRADLAFHRQPRRSVQPNTPYEFLGRTAEHRERVRVAFPQAVLEATAPPADPVFPPRPAPRPFRLESVADLAPIAAELDAREAALATRYGGRAGYWQARLAEIDYRLLDAAGHLGLANRAALVCDGWTHLAGMVSSGKTSFALLLAAYSVRHCPEQRITLVVGDAQTAIQRANEINWWFCDSPETDTPVAVPFLGRRTRDRHLRALEQSAEYRDYLQRGQPHWGERWLNTACGVQALVQSQHGSGVLDGQPLIPGSEPCQALERPQSIGQGKGHHAAPRHLCPLFARCPSQQMYHDLPAARVWITTPGSMASGSLPRQLESRPVRIGEWVYEQSDLVIFDEADTVIGWLDNVYAERVDLANGQDGVFDTVGVQTAAAQRRQRVVPPLTSRWTGAERASETLITTTLTLLDRNLGPHDILRDWVARGYFTPNALFYGLARRLVEVGTAHREPNTGVPATPASREDAERRLQAVVAHFDKLLDASDPLVRSASARPAPVEELADLMQQINSSGDSAVDPALHAACRDWITRWHPDVADHLASTAQAEIQATRRGTKVVAGRREERDTLETLTYRLQFALTVALLDRHTRIVFYEWHNRPDDLGGVAPYRQLPPTLLNILPLPPTGRQFGTYYLPARPADAAGTQARLALFAYTNIGRWYVLNFHRLFTDLTGRRGPNTLALSGTSYLPHSTRFHLGPPDGMLMPTASAQDAIAQSEFAYLPQRDRTGRPIRISGPPQAQKAALLETLVHTLLGAGSGGHLAGELAALEQNATRDPAHWEDRARLLILVNSYDQAHVAAASLRERWPAMRNHVHHLIPDGEIGEEGMVSRAGHGRDRLGSEGAGAVRHSDVERFAYLGGRILVAPLGAMGRGVNILNTTGKAAFGTVYFLTRPYPYPHNSQAIAQELNYRALEWADDPTFAAWAEDGVLARATALRRLAADYWRRVEQRTYYHTLHDVPELRATPRQDLAATTAGLMVQAVGRLVRGGVPCRAYFVDAAWAPQTAIDGKPETARTSLLAALTDVLDEYVASGAVGDALYAPLLEVLVCIEGFERAPFRAPVGGLV
jgi:hypothetical protein